MLHKSHKTTKATQNKDPPGDCLLLVCLQEGMRAHASTPESWMKSAVAPSDDVTRAVLSPADDASHLIRK